MRIELVQPENSSDEGGGIFNDSVADLKLRWISQLIMTPTEINIKSCTDVHKIQRRICYPVTTPPKLTFRQKKDKMFSALAEKVTLPRVS